MPQSLRHALGTLILAGSVLLSGCSAISQLTPAATVAPARATLILNPELRSNAPMRTQAVVSRLTADDVHHIRLQLLRFEGDALTTVDDSEGPLTLRIQRSDLTRPVVLSQLHPQTHYQVWAWAYSSPDETNETLISTLAPIDVVVGDDDRPTVARLPIQLKDVPFNGKATFPSFEIHGGGYVPDGVESVNPDLVWIWVDSLLPTLDATEDRVGPKSVGPDGQPDAHFRFSVDLPKGVSIHAIDLYPVEPERQQFWSTWDYRMPQEDLLTVAHGDQLLNTDFARTIGSFDGLTVFDLYAGSRADFPAGSSYDLLIILSNGTVLLREFTLPTQQETTP